MDIKDLKQPVKGVMSHSTPTPRANLHAALSTLEAASVRSWRDVLPAEQWEDLTLQLAKPGATAMLYVVPTALLAVRGDGGGG
jgi:hypothetical protein